MLQRALRVDASEAARVGRVVALVRREVSLVSGDRLPARWPALREAMLDGAIGVAGMLAAIGPIEKVGDRIGVDERWGADEYLAQAARGVHDDTSGASGTSDTSEEGARGPAPTQEDLRLLAEVLAGILDPDGEEPGDEPARRRGITVGRIRDGLRPPACQGWVSPPVHSKSVSRGELKDHLFR